MFGARIISSPAAGGSNQAVATAKKLAEENPDWVMLYQYGNARTRRPTTRAPGRRSCAICRPHHFVAGLGTTGTLMGAALPAREGARRPGHCRRAALRRARLRAAQHRRGLRAGAVRRQHPDVSLLRDVYDALRRTRDLIEHEASSPASRARDPARGVVHRRSRGGGRRAGRRRVHRGRRRLEVPVDRRLRRFATARRGEARGPALGLRFPSTARCRLVRRGPCVPG